ncbi:hypothetical protein PLANTIT3_30153 [Plantibacter sp. T3]|nr:hypothetical protein PLANTIT3_30153 [Plantibacter sp. T3]
MLTVSSTPSMPVLVILSPYCSPQ